ncbi:MAG: hypothetical protein CENE_03078 [Candidatus Celerinatantimonas neptuna]|nr:MAG: hypothetical protein CENE_03078 [Candidatus Celerinatantimonas neptuna]
MLKQFLRYVPIGFALLASYSYADVDPYFTVQEIGIDQTGSLADARHELTGAAVSEDGDFITSNAQAVRTPFSFFDINQPYTFGYGCQYASYVCDLYWNGAQTNGVDIGDGFDDYRELLKTAFNDGSGYSSQFFALTSSDLSSATATASSSFSNVDVLTDSSGDSVLSKYYVFDTSSSDNHDTHITDMTSEKETIGGVSAYWVTGYDFSPDSQTAPKGFVESLDGDYRISLTPSYTSTGGGLSVGYTFGEDSSGNLYVAGMSSTALVDSDTTSFDECYKDGDTDGSGYYRYCPGFETQAWVWSLGSISSLTSGTTQALSGTALASGWLNSKSANYFAAALRMNDEGAMAGFSSYSDSSSRRGARARAALYTYDGSTTHRYTMSGTDLIGASNDDDVRDQWAVDITDPISSSVYVVGNERLTTSKAASEKNQAVNFFISKLSSVSSGVPTSGAGTVKWPLEDNPFDGANNEIGAIDHTTGLAVGWRDASGQTQTSYNGISREQAAFLFDVPGYMSNGDADSHVWSLASLTCYEEGTTAKRPFYRFEYAKAIQSDGSNIYVLASGYKYPSKADYIDKVDATPVLFKLTHSGTSAPDSSSLSSCPDYSASTEHYKRQGADGSWLGLLLLPVLLVRFVTKRKK